MPAIELQGVSVANEKTGANVRAPKPPLHRIDIATSPADGVKVRSRELSDSKRAPGEQEQSAKIRNDSIWNRFKYEREGPAEDR